MKVCEDHKDVVVVYATRKCPMCDLEYDNEVSNSDKMDAEDAAEVLRDELDVLRDEIKDLESRLKDVRFQ